MGFYRKARKLVLHPQMFFRDAKLKKMAQQAAVRVTALQAQKALPGPTAGAAAPAAAKSPVPAAPAKKPAAPPVKKPDSADFEIWLTYSHLVRNFSKAFPVNVIKYKSVHFWPALRFYIWLRLICAILGKNIKGKNLITSSPSLNWRKTYEDVHGAVCVDDLTGSSAPEDFLIFSNQNSVDLCRVGDRSYNRLSDPLFEVLENYGSVRKVELLKGQGPLAKHRYHEPTYILPSIIRTSRHHLLMSGLQEATVSMVAAFPAAELSEGIINVFVDEFFNLKETYKKILLEYKPKAVFFSPIDYSYPLILACRECGVVAVDIQHGNHVGFNLPYNHWDEAPDRGYDLFPDAFLAWGSREQKAMSRSFPSTKIVTAGYPWLDFFTKLMEGENKVATQVLSMTKNYRFVVAVTMRDQVQFPPLLADIISDSRATENGILFIIKPHPKNDRLEGIPGSTNVVLPKGIKEMSIADLASHVDLHVTVNSSSIFEFEYYGVPSFVFGKEPLSDYEDLLEEGRLKYFSSANDFYREFDGLADRQTFEPLIDNRSDQLHEFILSIIGKDEVGNLASIR